MLETLRIQHYALIDTLEVDFRKGFSVLTGETGAGKSIIVGALNLVLGARASAETVRDGASKATIEALFRIAEPRPALHQVLGEYDLELDDHMLLLSRSVSADGRSRAFINGRMVPVGVLAAVGDELVDLHGQHEHQSLLKVDRQLGLLDAFGGLESDVRAVAGAVQACRAAEARLRELESADRDRGRQIDFMKFEVDEIDKAGLVPGEEDELKGRRNVIANAEQIALLATSIYQTLYESEGSAAIDLLANAGHELDELAQIDKRLAPLMEQLDAARTAVESVALEVRGCSEELEFNPEELEQLNHRLSLISDLKRKYTGTVEEILAYRDRIADEVESFEHRDERIAALRREHDQQRENALTLAEKVSTKRSKAAKQLEKQVSGALQDLGMKGASFAVRLDRVELCSDGVDRAEFLLAANPGEKEKPLRLVASGGEISRIMLALKSVFAAADAIPTLVFDEIDAGVGGAVATKVADKLQRLAVTHQVLCITHLPQIAAVANAHYNVAKSNERSRTTTRVQQVVDAARVEEIARMLDGSLSEVSLDHARALLARK
jgi:DNA repair protein RecN (Recombination protein N)